MTLEAFPFRVHWGQPVVERWEWQTDVLLPEDGATEQRIALRQKPRYTLEGTVRVEGGEASFLANVLRAARGQAWHYPLWHQIAYLPAPRGAGVTTLNVDTAGQLFGGVSYLLFWRNPFYFEVRTLTNYSTSQLQFQALNRGFSRGDRVYPALPGRLLQATEVRAITESLAESRVQVAFDQAPTVTGVDADPFLTRPERSAPVSTTLAGREYRIDYGLGPRWQAGRQSPEQVITYPFLLGSRAQIDALRRFVAYRRGRQVALRMPRWVQPYRLAEDAEDGAETLTVWRCGHAETVTGDLDLVILKANRTDWWAVTVTGATADGAYEVLALEDPLSGAIPMSDVWGIYPLQRCRLDTDVIEFAYYSDTLARVTLPVHVL